MQVYYPYIIPLEIVLVQLCGTYLRYLPFQEMLADIQKKRLLYQALFLAFLCWTFHTAVLHYFPARIGIYKVLMSIGWIPFFLSELYIIRNQVPQHIFILGMQALWGMLIHSVGNTVLTFFIPIPSKDEFIPFQALCYLIMILVTLPIARHCFKELLPSRHLINDLPFGYYIAFLPIALSFSHMSNFMANAFPSLRMSPSRIFIGISFFLLYRYILLERKTNTDYARRENNSRLVNQQLQSLQSYTRLMQDSQQQVSILRHDMRHNIRLLYTLIQEGAIKEALEVITSLDDSLKRTVIRPYSANPIINAALSIYIHRAEDLHIPITQSVQLPARLPEYENDLAIVLSNLIENAIIASLKQPSDRREIQLTITTKGSQIVVGLSNRCDIPLRLNEDGLPQTQAQGHGTGMISLQSFAEKHNAYTDFTQEDGCVNFMMYWTIDSPKKNNE